MKVCGGRRIAVSLRQQGRRQQHHAKCASSPPARASGVCGMAFGWRTCTTRGWCVAERGWEEEKTRFDRSGWWIDFVWALATWIIINRVNIKNISSFSFAFISLFSISLLSGFPRPPPTSVVSNIFHFGTSIRVVGTCLSPRHYHDHPTSLCFVAPYGSVVQQRILLRHTIEKKMSTFRIQRRVV